VENLEKNFWKAIATVPTKARFEGFQLAVIGRFAPRWRNLLFKIVKLILLMRYIPSSLKKMARFPIPKPGRHNEYRPISLCHDLYCYIMGVVTSYSSAAIEKAGILHNGLTAYQKGKGCANLVTTELSFREDCLENYVPSVQIDEDEEKFFDRIPVEILLAAMRVNGFPTQGYIEIKASAMEAKTVEIITAKGVTYARFICGLEQGNPDSPTVSNLVIKFKHDVWGHISREIKTIFERNNTQCQENYKFNSVDLKDGQLYLCKIGYSDDNSKYISIQNEEDLLDLVRYFTQLSGDISMVTKIGRKSAKCEVQFFNITAKLALKMEKVWSTAWSFEHDSPIEEQIPFKIHMKANELKEFYRISDFFNLTEDEQIAWNNIIGAEAHKHLGLSSTLAADTSTSWMKTLEKMKEKLVRLNIYKMHNKAQRKCFNMLVGTMPTFVPVQVNFPSSALLQFDRYAASFCLKSNGLSASDSKIRMFLPESMGGLGLISTMELDIISVAREFEVISNNMSLDSNAFRTRISALDNYPFDEIFLNRNHAREAIEKLARYGIYIRSSDEEHINEILVEIGKSEKGFLPFTDCNYKDTCTIGIGLGKQKNVELMYGGPIHSVLKLLQDNQWKPAQHISSAAKSTSISVPKLISIRNKVLKTISRQPATCFSFWEWRNKYLANINSIPDSEQYWKYYDTFQSRKECGLLKSCAKCCRLNWDTHIRFGNSRREISFNQYVWEGRLLKLLMESNSPLIVATDGSNSTQANGDKTISSFVICMLNIKPNETIDSGEWVDRSVIPILSRSTILPTNFGNIASDIAHGESYAILMAEMALLDIPRVTITDSKAIRKTMMKIRDLDSEHDDRSYIRSVAGGTGKFICGLMKNLTFKSKNSSSLDKSHHVSPPFQVVCDRLETRNKKFLEVAKSWVTPPIVNEDDGAISGWDPEYLDEHSTKPFLKVNSHQLNKMGTGIKTTPRYKKLIPNLSVLSANHFADCCADYAKKFDHSPYVFDRPFPFLRFYLTCGGKNIDRNVSDFCHEQFSLLKIRKLKLKETQGLLWRILPLSTTSWDTLRLNKGWLRLLLGLSSTHTRRIYKSEIYRECSKAKFKSNESNNTEICREIDEAGNSRTIELLSGCLWCGSNDHLRQKGNRNHAILSCKNKELSDFRTKTSNLIESKLKLFFLELQRATNFQQVEECIAEVEKSFLLMQERNEGRLKPITNTLNNRYIPIASILVREGIPDLAKALDSKKFNLCCEIFGFLPNLNGTAIRDDQIGVMDCAWLGLIPIAINACMEKFCDKVYDFVNHKDTAKAISANLHHSWKEIKTITMGKAIGLHRLICSTGKSKEKEWKKEFTLDLNTFRKIKRESNPEKFNTNLKRKANFYPKARKKRRTTLDKQEEKDMKTCCGISCNGKNKSWYPNNSFATNRIRTSIKQCQRCSRYMTAIKQCRTIFGDITNSNIQIAFDKLYSFIKKNQSGLKFNYAKLMILINNCLNKHSKIEYKATNMKRIPDRFKLIGNILSITLRKATNNFSQYDNKTLQRSASILQTVTSSKESDFNLTREAEIKIKLLTSKNVSNSYGRRLAAVTKNTQTISTIPNHETDQPQPTSAKLSYSQPETHHNELQPSTPLHRIPKRPQPQQCKHDLPLQNIAVVALAKQNKPALAKFAADIIRPSICLLGDGMMKAVEVLRSYKTPHLFIATAEASNQIVSWQPSQNWNKFAKMFRSTDLTDSRPNGTYLIPMFSGGKGIGHWYLLVIKKIRRRFVRAWCIDSMGVGNVEQSIKKKIEEAFAPGRTTLRWETCTTRSQEELECGPRTVLAMKIIKEGIETSLPIEDSIQIAALWRFPYNHHTPSEIREEIAYFINQFTPEMITPPVRFRQRRSNSRPSRNIPTPSITCIDIDSSQHEDTDTRHRSQRDGKLR